MYPSFTNLKNLEYNGNKKEESEAEEEEEKQPLAPSSSPSPSTIDASAPLLSLIEKKQTEKKPRKAKAPSVLVEKFKDKVCAICHKILLTDTTEEVDVSLVLFGKCSHVVHLACVATQLKNMGSTFREGQWQQSCAECLLKKSDTDNDYDLDDHEHEEKVHEYLRSFKVRFSSTHQGQSYDQFKHTMASHELKRYMLCGEPTKKSFASSAMSSLAPSSLKNNLASIASRLRLRRTETLEIADENEENKGDDVDYQIRTNTFVDLMFKRKRTLDDILALDDGNLLQLYRCGVQSYDDLRALGFNPVLHLLGVKTPKVPVWQLHDLYGFHFEHLVDEEAEDGFAMPIRDVLEFVDMQTLEWAIIGATSAKFVALHITKEYASNLKMPLKQWEKYLRLQPAHLQAMGICTRKDFIDLMQWDKSSPLCPIK